MAVSGKAVLGLTIALATVATAVFIGENNRDRSAEAQAARVAFDKCKSERPMAVPSLMGVAADTRHIRDCREKYLTPEH